MTNDVEPVVDGELVRSAGEWAEVIQADLNRAVDGIVSAGRNLMAAKADVRHGEWLPMLKQIGISNTVAANLMSIGGNPALANSRNCENLPTAARALYELSRLEPEQIEAGIESGDITANMTITEARNFAADELIAAEPAPDPEPAAPVIGLDGKRYQPKPPAPQPRPAQPRRRPLPETAADIAHDMEKLRGRINRLIDDDRFAANRDTIAGRIGRYEVLLSEAFARLHESLSGET